jgi:competence protein ComEA
MKFLLTLLATCMLASMAWAAEPVNINTASAEQIAESLNGVGLSKAALIVQYREANGPYTHMDELVNVKGIGLRTVDKNRELILVQGAGTQANN